jgi:hypothetical protein
MSRLNSPKPGGGDMSGTLGGLEALIRDDFAGLHPLAESRDRPEQCQSGLE